MAISNFSSDVFMAILAMDAYNRDYDAGIILSGSSLGDVTLGINSSVLRDANEARRDIPVSFFAQTYISGEQKVISYRGTDNPVSLSETWGDIWEGWGAGGGSPGGSQANLSAEFYNRLAGANPRESNIILAGHSLGGGLAGFIGMLYGKKAILFDNMPFELASSNAYRYSLAHYRGPTDPYFNPGYATLRNTIYGATVPWINDPSKIKAFAVNKEVWLFRPGYARLRPRRPKILSCQCL